jgi:hypothetical protein
VLAADLSEVLPGVSSPDEAANTEKKLLYLGVHIIDLALDRVGFYTVRYISYAISLFRTGAAIFTHTGCTMHFSISKKIVLMTIFAVISASVAALSICTILLGDLIERRSIADMVILSPPSDSVSLSNPPKRPRSALPLLLLLFWLPQSAGAAPAAKAVKAAPALRVPLRRIFRLTLHTALSVWGIMKYREAYR